MVVVDGETDLELLPRTEPRPGLRLKAVGLPVTVQERRAELPKVMYEGEEVKLLMVGAGVAGRLRVVKVKSGEDVLLDRASVEVTLKW